MGISLREWKALARKYLRFKKLGEYAFRNWMDRNLYRRLELEISITEFFIESIPLPEENFQSEEERDSFVMDLERRERELFNYIIEHSS